MPLKFWDEAFLTATFPINLLPSKVINFDTPVQRLLNHTPNYESLRVFGCACWPNLRPYNKTKLAFRSMRCVVLGYSPRHKGVKCLDTKTGRVYISRDVLFDENVFPFASLHPNAGSRLRQDILLLPSTQNTSSTSGDARVDDYMPLPFIPIVTPNDQDNADTVAPHVSGSSPSSSAENSAHNEPENDATSDSENSEEDEPGDSHVASDQENSDPEADPTVDSPAAHDPEVADSARPPSPMRPASPPAPGTH